jgi:Ca2+-binding RTX toxin-like protein
MPFLFFLGLLATSAAMGSFVELGSSGDEDNSGPDPEQDTPGNQDGEGDEVTSPEQDLTWLIGEEGADDALAGSDGADTLVGNAGDADSLTGGAGDDSLWVARDNVAEGGTGADRFFVQADDHEMGRVTDFNPQEDTLVVRDYVNPVDGSSDGLIVTQEDDGLALRNADTGDVHLALPGASLGEGQSLSVMFQTTDGGAHDSAVLSEELRDFQLQDAPYVADALRGTSEDETLVGGAGDDVLFGEGGADVLQGGGGDDDIYSGRGNVFYASEWHHEPGYLERFGADDSLDGGAGEDRMWLGSGNVATGGAEADNFYAMAGVYDSAAEITDFNAGEDRLVVNFGLDGPFGTSYQNAEVSYFTVETAASGFEMTYDASNDQTRLSLGGEPLMILNGDQTGVSVAFSNQNAADEYDLPEEWRDANGDPISADAGQSADIVFSGMAPQDLYDANGNGGMVA